MGLVIWGGIAYVIGMITKIKVLETVGYYLVIGGLILFGLGFLGINLPIPVSAF